MRCMQIELKKLYPNLELGTYFHHVSSIHIYETHLEILNEMLSKKIHEDRIPTIELQPINNPDIIRICENNCYDGTDVFFKWLFLKTNLKIVKEC